MRWIWQKSSEVWKSNVARFRKTTANIEKLAQQEGLRGRNRTQSLANSTRQQQSNRFPTLKASAHNFFVNAILKRVTNTQAAALRRRAARQLFNGNARPFLALVGVSLASGTGIITKQDELDCICSEIRRAAAKTLETTPTEAPREDEVKSWTLKDFQFGPVIAKGCNAVVHAAKMTFCGLEKMAGNQTDLVKNDEIYTDPKKVENENSFIGVKPATSGDEYPLAIKMMFNYEAESNAISIFNTMYREIVPARNVVLPEEITDWFDVMRNQKVDLPRHPNVANVHLAFVDRIPSLEGCFKLYPEALPRRINPDGFGRNMSLFLVMKRYDQNLKEYLAKNKESLRWKTSLIMLTQILEGVSHLVRNNVAHRDLKCDNILVEAKGSNFPKLVITDFGCCLADSSVGLKLPFTSYSTDRGGNAALMAPEVAGANPGIFNRINYGKSDAWTVGTLAYEIFGMPNPFYGENGSKKLSSRTYRGIDELPELPSVVPVVVRKLIAGLLEPNPGRRLSAEEAANICQLLLWAPSSWTREGEWEMIISPGTQEILQWLLTVTTKILYESRFSNSEEAGHEYHLVGTFLSRFNLNDVRRCLEWIHRNHE